MEALLGAVFGALVFATGVWFGLRAGTGRILPRKAVKAFVPRPPIQNKDGIARTILEANAVIPTFEDGVVGSLPEDVAEQIRKQMMKGRGEGFVG